MTTATSDSVGRLETLRNIVVGLIAAIIIEALAIALWQHVHAQIDRHSAFSSVFAGFTRVPLEVLTLIVYLGVTALRYVGAMLATRPLFRQSSGDGKVVRSLVGLSDTSLNVVTLALLFIAASALGEIDGYGEALTWLLFVLASDVIVCLFWLATIRFTADATLGLGDTQRANIAKWNRRWLVATIIEMLCVVALMVNESQGGSAVPAVLCWLIIVFVVASDIYGNREHWEATLTG